jgi:hypothetical protein
MIRGLLAEFGVEIPEGLERALLMVCVVERVVERVQQTRDPVIEPVPVKSRERNSRLQRRKRKCRLFAS